MADKTPHPVSNLASIFVARRDLLAPIRDFVLKDSGLSVEDADLLVFLYGQEHLGWWSFDADEEGFILQEELRRALVHSPARLSQRISKLAEAGLLESRRLRETRRGATGDSGHHGNTSCVRITGAGVNAIEPIWQRYKRLAETILQKIEPEDLAAHSRVNMAVSTRINEIYRAPLQAAIEGLL